MSEETAQPWRRTLRGRFVVAAALLVAWSAVIEARLVYLQVVRHAEMTARAERQQSRTITAAAKRGEILDREGRVLAYSVDADSVYAVPTEVDDPAGTAAAVCGALGDCTPRSETALVERLGQQRAFVYVRRKVTPEQARRVAELDLAGVGFVTEDRRFYPNKEMAAHVLGYVGTDHEGLGGIEAAYDGLIKGKAGTVLVQTDARRRGFSRLEKPPTTGATLELTIDQYLQHVAERELQAAVTEHRAAGGAVIVMDPYTGELLALANAPTFNPNAFRQAPADARRNRAVQDLYEPGSTFKIVTASAALDEHVVAPDEPIDVSAGTIRFGRRVIRDVHRYDVLSFTDVIVKSSNVGAIKIGLRVGPERLGLYVKRFGFGRPTSPDFKGESAGIVWNPARLNDSALASVSMGYQVGVTPLQMAAALSAVANGGELYEPRVVRAVIRDGRRTAVPHKLVRRAISNRTAATLTDMMTQVVERGTGTAAHVPGFSVAGKTGTAQKVVDGKYSTSEYNASFVGFVPSHQPVFAIVVMIDAPRGPKGYFGGAVAAPVFEKVAEAGLRHYGVVPTINAPAPLVVAERDERRERQTSGGLAPRTIVPVGAVTRGGEEAIPDLTGVSARDALRVLTRLGMTPQLMGAGVVAAQRPHAGVPLERGATVTLWLGRSPALEPHDGTHP